MIKVKRWQGTIIRDEVWVLLRALPRTTRLLLVKQAVLLVDCKTVRIFAYSRKRDQSNKRSGARLKTESETWERR